MATNCPQNKSVASHFIEGIEEETNVEVNNLEQQDEDALQHEQKDQEGKEMKQEVPSTFLSHVHSLLRMPVSIDNSLFNLLHDDGSTHDLSLQSLHAS